MTGERLLLIGYGNPGRLDDGLGPALAEKLAEKAIPGLTVDANYLLTVEDAHAVAAHDVVIFADASVNGPEPLSFRRIMPAPALSFSSHSNQPEAILGLARVLFGAETRGYVLAIRGYRFDEFGEELSPGACGNLDVAVRLIEELARSRHFDAYLTDAPRGDAEGVDRMP